MFGGSLKTLHPETVSKLQTAGAFACFCLASVLAEFWEPSNTTVLTTVNADLVTDDTTTHGRRLFYVNKNPITPEIFLPQLGSLSSRAAPATAGNEFQTDVDKNISTPETFIPQTETELSQSNRSEVSLSDASIATAITLTSGKALLNTHQVFANLLQPEGFKRRDWQDFEHIKLQNAVVKQTSLSPVPSIAKKNHTDTDDATFTVLIDPGHGGWDPGSVAHNGLQEKHLTLDIARRVELFLSEVPDINVILTRTEDVSLRRKARVQKIKNAATDLVVSLHFNHLPEPNVNLVESFYASPNDIIESQKLREQPQASTDNFYQVTTREPASYNRADLSFTRGSKRLAKILHKRVYDEVSLDNKKVIDAGVKTDMLYVLTQSFTPGVLMELTAISNIKEAERLTDENYRNRLAAALVDGIRNYRESLHKNPLNGTGT